MKIIIKKQFKRLPWRSPTTVNLSSGPTVQCVVFGNSDKNLYEIRSILCADLKLNFPPCFKTFITTVAIAGVIGPQGISKFSNIVCGNSPSNKFKFDDIEAIELIFVISTLSFSSFSPFFKFSALVLLLFLFIMWFNGVVDGDDDDDVGLFIFVPSVCVFSLL